ncbi:MAG: acetolactate decarboxylase [Streptococcaceae bacterium]|jgi:acetolactate decarboxylase|nr:acetolactate decarboxylase [Streptococcaceae bacterium]
MNSTKILYQFNTLGALMAGLYDGNFSLSAARAHGDFGIGTFHEVDGEMIVLDDMIYQATGDGNLAAVKKITDLSQKVPYIALTNFEPADGFDFSGNESDIRAHLQTENLFYALKLTGIFSMMQVRMAPRTPSGMPFDRVAENQPEFTREKIAGTVLGFFTPELFNGISAAGLHLHFISADKTFGGHAMAFAADKATLELMALDKLEQEFPSADTAFLAAKLDVKTIQQAIDSAE